MTDHNNRLVEEYLEAVARATTDLPPEERFDLLIVLREHIVAARAELQPETQAGVREILNKLGDPANIAAEARLGNRNTGTFSRVGPPKRQSPRWVLVSLVVFVVLALAGLGIGLYLARPAPQSHVPAIVGLPQPDAEARLSQARLHGSVTVVFDSTCAKGTVVRQDDPPGYPVAQNSAVIYDVCGGPRQ